MCRYTAFVLPAFYVVLKVGAPVVLSFMVLIVALITGAKFSVSTIPQMYTASFFLGAGNPLLTA